MILGDFREYIDALSYDLIITDAPYGVGYEYATYDDTVDNLDALIADMSPYLLDESKRAYVFPGIQNMHRWPQPYWTMVWYQPAGASTGRYGFSSWQPILCYGKDPRLVDGLGRYQDVFVDRSGSRRSGGDDTHPCEKPLSVMRWLIDRVTRPDDTILDPMAGSGTTLIAAAEAGIDAIGIELDPVYVDRAARRMAQGALFAHG